MEVVPTAVRKSEDSPDKKPEDQLTYRERVLKLGREKAPLLDPETFKTDIFESDEECEEFIEKIYRHRRSFTA